MIDPSQSLKVASITKPNFRTLNPKPKTPNHFPRIALKKSLKVASILKEELVIVEDGQKEGDTVWYKPNGDALRAFQYVVPEGAMPGDRIYVQPLKRDYNMSAELNSERLEKIQAQRR